MPKRKFEALEAESGEVVTETEGESEDSNSSIHTNSSSDVPSKPKEYTSVRNRKRVKFNGVTVFYFPRKQGFVCVPSQGGSTLGMADQHMATDCFSVPEYARHQRQLHRQILAEQQGTKVSKLSKRSGGESSAPSSGESESSEDELNVDDYYFLQPVPTRQRRLMLRQAGIKKIDTVEKEECKDIRSSRESCGCDCRVYCDPETCACSIAGIKCQVDRLSFPCGCSKEGCGNLSGRIEFNPIRVRTHFIHTLMRLEMDKKQEEERAFRKQRQKEGGVQLQSPPPPVCPELLSNPDPPSTAATKKPEDVCRYNSNERGSCCDCQNSDIHDFLMQESQFTAGNGGGGNGGPVMAVEMHAGPPAANRDYMAGSANEVGMESTSARVIPGSKPAENLPQVLLFNDSDDDYTAENTTSLYAFNKEDSSYSESSDCSSETSVSESDANNVAAHFHTFPDGSPFPAGADSALESHNVPYAIPPVSTAQSQHKFMDLNGAGSTYKLEPISEILNPIRFPGYSPPTTTAGWANCGGDTYPIYNATELTEGQTDSKQYDASGYMFTGQSSSTTPEGHHANMSCLLPTVTASTTLPEQYLDPQVSPYNRIHTDTYSSSGADDASTDAAKVLTRGGGASRATAEEKKCTEVPLASSSIEEGSQSDSSNMETPEAQYHDLSTSLTSSQDLCDNKLAPASNLSNLTSAESASGSGQNSPSSLSPLAPSGTSSTQLHPNQTGSSEKQYHDLSNSTGQSQNKKTFVNCHLVDGKAHSNGHGKNFDNLSLSCVSPRGNSQKAEQSHSLTEMYTLPERQSVFAVSEPVSLQGISDGRQAPKEAPLSGGPESTKLVQDKIVQKNGVNLEAKTNGIDSEHATQNFGEIIKESIVETVSA